MQTIDCESRISSVVVYARGALVTRDVTVGALPSEPVLLRVLGVSALALPGSFRASLVGGREVVSLRSQLCLPEVAAQRGDLVERSTALRRELEKLNEEFLQLKELRDLLEKMELRPKLQEERFRAEQLLQKMKGSLAASRLTRELRASLDEQHARLQDKLTEKSKRLSALELEMRQASQQETLGQKRRTREALIQLSSSGEARELRLMYAVQAARWWPAYTARINGEQVKFALDAFIAQSTEEDWTNVSLSLSTADMIHDARLPELASLRFSKAQPPPKRAFRAPPKGLELLYRGYDEAFSGVSSVPPVSTPPMMPISETTTIDNKPTGGIFSRLGSLLKSDINDAIKNAEDPEKMLNTIILEMNTQLVEAKKQVSVAIADEKRLEQQKNALPGNTQIAAMYQQQRSATENLKVSLRGLQNKIDEARRKKDLLIARTKRADAQRTIQKTLTGVTDNSAFETFERMQKKVDQLEAEAEAYADLDMEQGGGGLIEAGVGGDALAALKSKMGLAGASSASFTRMTAQLSEAMLDFRLLEMGDSQDHSVRGRLQIVTQTTVDFYASVASIEACRAPLTTTDPLYGRGQFDSMYHASATCDVPANARVHRVAICSADAPSQQEFLCIPKEDVSVYRSLVLTNPFESALLAGPVDIFIAGAFVTTSSFTAVDKGGKLMIGLGVEDRIKVVRNARAQESTAGLLRGKTEVDHVITIEASSTLTRDATLRVIDRIPVTDQKDLEVTIVSQSPESVAYDQAERSYPVRGGLLWRLTVKPEQRSKITLHYKLGLPAKNEIIGGNRRD